MNPRLFFPLVVLWPGVFATLAWILAADIDPFQNDPKRTAKMLVLVAMVAGLVGSLGFADWWKLTLPEVEPESTARFMKRTHQLFGLVLALAAAAYAFVWLIDPTGFRLLPLVVAVIAYAGVRMELTPEKQNSATTPDVMHSYDTRIPESMKENSADRGDKI